MSVYLRKHAELSDDGKSYQGIAYAMAEQWGDLDNGNVVLRTRFRDGFPLIPWGGE